MKILEEVSIAVIQAHLKNTGTAIGLHKNGVGCTGYRVLLDADDVGKLFLWWEHQIHTKDLSRKVLDALPSAASNCRIKAFIEGDSSRGLLPVDLRTTRGLEIVAEVENIASTRFNVIDGNHRTIAQQLKHGTFQDVPMFVCVRNSG